MEQQQITFSQPKRNLSLKKVLLFVLSPAALIILGGLVYLLLKYPTTYPGSAISFIYQASQAPHIHSDKEIIGFLPYWRLDDTKYIKLSSLNEVIFFSLTADENGNIVKVVNHQTDPGWRWWNSQVVKDLIAKTQISGDRFVLSIAIQKGATLEKFLDHKQAQNTLLSNLLREVKSRNLNGVNIDFEIGSLKDDSYRPKFTNFAATLAREFKSQSPSTELSVDTFPLSVRDISLDDFSALLPLFDKFIVMSYDYYGTSSDTAGPVAPMNGYKAGKFFFDITSTYQDYLSVLPSQKIVMGIPYYGWDFPVEDGTEFMSKTLEQNGQNGYPEVISYARMRQDPDITPSQCRWDALAEEYWCYYTDKNQISHQVWLENDQSIGDKFDFANQKRLDGIAIWTLGYDKEYPNLWDLIQKNFALTPRFRGWREMLKS